MIEVSVLTISFPLPDSLWSPMRQRLPPRLVESAKRLRRTEDRQRSLCGRLLLERALRRRGYGGNLWEEFSTDACGKPRVAGPFPFSLSHSGDYVVCAVSDRGAVGVDVERIVFRGAQEFDGIFTPEECDELRRAADPVREGYRLWTMKEAALKADGRALTVPVEAVRLSGTVAQIEDKRWAVADIPLRPGYVACLAAEPGQDSVCIWDALQ